LTDRSSSEAALGDILVWLAESDYAFVTPTGQTHALVRRRGPASREDLLRDVFGWTRRFNAADLDPALLGLLRRADVLRDEDDGLRLSIRASTVEGRLFLHSAPTSAADAVFLGPDSYRYARFLRQAGGAGAPVRQALDIGVGAGVGAVTLALLHPGAEVTGSDINDEALRLARVNVDHNGVPVRIVKAAGIPAAPDGFDLIAANPPYIAGPMKRTYRDGGGDLGAGLALDWVRDGLPRLRPGGRFLLYTGSAIVRGRDGVRAGLERLASAHSCRLDYDEIDPDVFGGVLRQQAYREVERIAVVGAVLTAP